MLRPEVVSSLTMDVVAFDPRLWGSAMRVLPIGLGLAGIALLSSAIGLAIWAGMPSNPLTTLGILTGQAGPISKLVFVLLIAQAIGIAVLAVRAATGRGSSDPTALTILSFVPPGLGLAATLFGGLAIRVAVERTHTTELVVVAPSLAEVMTPLAFGLLVGTAAAALRARQVQAGQAPT